MEKAIDWTKFTRRIFINCDLRKVYDAWTIPAQIEKWFLESANYTQADGSPRPGTDHYKKGDTFEWKWHNWDFKEQGQVQEANGKDYLKFTFAGGSVGIKLKETDHRTEMILLQEGIKTDEKSRYDVFYSCSLGWSFWMVNLKAWLEHGITLNETQPVENNGIELVNS